MRRIIAALLIALTCSVGLGATHGADAADPGAEVDFANRVNALRAYVHVAPLGLHSVLTAKAEAWAAQMAATGCLCHSNLPDGVTVGWRKLGENIGLGSSVASLDSALKGSAPHYANMVDGAFRWIGVGVAYGGGGMYVAEVFMDGDPPPIVRTWSGWDGLGGALGSAPASASWGSNRVDAFATDSGGSLTHKWWDGYRWNGWENLGGNLASAPTVAAWGPNRLDIFARGSGGELNHKWWDGYHWNGWENLGGDLTSAPTVAAWGPNRLDIFARGSGGELIHKWWDGYHWNGWESLGGGVVGDPASASWGGGRLDVFVRGTDNRLYHRWYGGNWSAWESLGGALSAGPSATSWGPNRLDVFVRGTDNRLYHQWFGGGWSSWDSLGGALSAGPERGIVGTEPPRRVRTRDRQRSVAPLVQLSRRPPRHSVRRARARRLPSCIAATRGTGIPWPSTTSSSGTRCGAGMSARPVVRSLVQQIGCGRDREIGGRDIVELVPRNGERHRRPGAHPRAVGRDHGAAADPRSGRRTPSRPGPP